MAFRAIACALASTLLVGATLAQSSAPDIVGRWQYIQPPDRHGEILDISLSNGRYKGIMNGLERAGEHGLFYYVVEVSDLSIGVDGSMRFTVGPRSYYRQRPKLSVLGASGDGGGTRESMHFSGRLEGHELVLQCKDPGFSCPDSSLRFKRLSTKLPKQESPAPR
jgi:hypothetical protein